MSLLQSIKTPNDLKQLDLAQLNQLCAELRSKLIQTVSETGGHLAPNLGVVELTVGAYRALNTPPDCMVFDVGHQSYVHKLLTGRVDDFHTLRTFGGVSGFPKRSESEFDLYGTGHASDSLSVALGYVLAHGGYKGAKTPKDFPQVVAMIGDGSMTGGMAWEALNHIGHTGANMTIILNDNEMSISQNVGALTSYLGRIRMDRRYWGKREFAQRQLERRGDAGKHLLDLGVRVRDSLKHLVVPGMIFEELGITYVGPIDGHDIEQVETAVRMAKEVPEPIVIHAITQKGRGYAPAENNSTLFHGVGAFDIKTGEVKANPDAPPAYTQIFGDSLVKEAEKNPDIVAITAAMPNGTGLDIFRDHFTDQPERFIDVGIAEEHAVGLASGLALGGKLPVVAIYSSFLQRSYDQIIGNVALQDAHVVFAIDRGGLVGEDGPTHHGVHDLSYLRTVPGMQILAPANEIELQDALHTALQLEGPVALRYPRGSSEGLTLPDEPSPWEYGKAVEVKRAADQEVVILAVGRMLASAVEASEILAEAGINASVANMRWVKPLDEGYLQKVASKHKLIVTLEENTVRGGFGSGVMEFLESAEIATPVLQIGTPDAFVAQGTVKELLEITGLDAQSVADKIIARLKK
ncbi:MAG: 1-deoxy-D-xylulose-5-phosphate synthase [Coriobacteriia bacterium]|nr:1-deoxy-D-xylulose-5-phosphate synthase [Coriobacteriia bacterium]